MNGPAVGRAGRGDGLVTVVGLQRGNRWSVFISLFMRGVSLKPRPSNIVSWSRDLSTFTGAFSVRFEVHFLHHWPRNPLPARRVSSRTLARSCVSHRSRDEERMGSHATALTLSKM